MEQSRLDQFLDKRVKLKRNAREPEIGTLRTFDPDGTPIKLYLFEAQRAAEALFTDRPFLARDVESVEVHR